MRIIIALITFLFGSLLLQGQSCDVGRIQFFDQKDIDSFAIKYPGCKIINGDISFNEDLNERLDYSMLDSVVLINGNIESLFTSLSFKLRSLERIDGNVLLGNAVVDSINPFPKLKVINGQLRFESISGLSDFQFLSTIDTILNGLIIGGMRGLESLSGFDSLIYSGGLKLDGVFIKTFEGLNPNLYIDSFLTIETSGFTDCTFKPICDFLVNVRGTPIIRNSGQGCKHEQLVRMQCLTPTDNYLIQQIEVYPNPATSEVVISAIPIECHQLKLTSTLGKVITTYTVNGSQMRLDISGINPGFYFLQFEGKEGLMGSKSLVVF